MQNLRIAPKKKYTLLPNFSYRILDVVKETI
jgi:hypothetical protein